MRRLARARWARASRGSISLEFALVMPLLLLLVLGTFTMGHALYVRYKLSGATSAVARACAVERATPGACQSLARQWVSNTSRWCLGGVVVNVQTVDVPGLTRTRGLNVQMDCQFVGGLGQAYLLENDISIAHFTVSALVPYSEPSP